MDFLTTVMVLSTPHLLYFYVWTQSKSFMKLVRKYAGARADPVQVFAKMAYAIKILQMLSVLSFYFNLGKVSWSDFTIPRLVIGLAIASVGQYLNAAIYRAIGVNGVYYGTRLGKNVPWVNGFPFNVVSHPQYVGSVISIWGITIMLYCGSMHNSLVTLSAIWTVFYAITGAVEQYM